MIGQGLIFEDTAKISVNKAPNGCFRVNHNQGICQAFIVDGITLKLVKLNSKIKDDFEWEKLDEFNSTKEVLVDSVIFFN